MLSSFRQDYNIEKGASGKASGKAVITTALFK